MWQKQLKNSKLVEVNQLVASRLTHSILPKNGPYAIRCCKLATTELPPTLPILMYNEFAQTIKSPEQ